MTALFGTTQLPFGAGSHTQVFLKEAERVQEADLKAWSTFAFDRHVVRERLDRHGGVIESHEMHFRVRPDLDDFDEQLLRIDGREPTAAEIREHRKAARFAKHYAIALSKTIDNPFGRDLPIFPLLYDQEVRLAGAIEIGGIPCYRFEFDADPEPDGKAARDRLVAAIRGSMCFSVEGAHLVSAQVETVRSVGSAMGMMKLKRLVARFEGRPFGDAWVPQMFELNSDLVVMGKKLRKRNLYQYSAYRASNGS